MRRFRLPNVTPADKSADSMSPQCSYTYFYIPPPPNAPSKKNLMKYLVVTNCFRTLVAQKYQLNKYEYDYHFQ